MEELADISYQYKVDVIINIISGANNIKFYISLMFTSMKSTRTTRVLIVRI